MPDEPRLASESIVGRRPYQEDAVTVRRLSDGAVLAAVADGMGGHAAGEVASALALETLVESLEDGSTVDRAFEAANRRVHEQARDPAKRGMGTTLTAAIVDDGEFMMANVGDSRGYLVSGRNIRQLTVDHSFVAEAMKRGQSEAQAMDTPYKDALTRSIGTEPEVHVDVFGPFPIEEDTALLVCSDGLHKALSDAEVLRIYTDSQSPREAARMLVEAALEKGSDDNISVAIAEYGEVPRTSSEDDGGVAVGAEAGEEKVRGDLPTTAPPEPRLDVQAEDRRAAASDDTVVAPRPGPPRLPRGGVVVVVVVVVVVLLWIAWG